MFRQPSLHAGRKPMKTGRATSFPICFSRRDSCRCRTRKNPRARDYTHIPVRWRRRRCMVAFCPFKAVLESQGVSST